MFVTIPASESLPIESNRVILQPSFMPTLPGEKILLQSTDDRLVLTTHRVRFHKNGSGDEKMVSIMLDELGICETMLRGRPWMLWTAAIMAFIGIQRLDFWFGIVVELAALYLFGSYYATRIRIISLRSAAGAMIVPTEKMPLEAVIKFIDTVEDAKNNRIMIRHKVADEDS